MPRMNTDSEKQGSVAVTVRILGKEYQVACPPSAQSELLDAARHLDENMRQIRDSGKVAGVDRIAVMAALNLAHEVLALNRELQQQDEKQVPDVHGQLDLSPPAEQKKSRH